MSATSSQSQVSKHRGKEDDALHQVRWDGTGDAGDDLPAAAAAAPATAVLDVGFDPLGANRLKLAATAIAKPASAGACGDGMPKDTIEYLEGLHADGELDRADYRRLAGLCELRRKQTEAKPSQAFEQLQWQKATEDYYRWMSTESRENPVAVDDEDDDCDEDDVHLLQAGPYGVICIDARIGDAPLVADLDVTDGAFAKGPGQSKAQTAHHLEEEARSSRCQSAARRVTYCKAAMFFETAAQEYGKASPAGQSLCLYRLALLNVRGMTADAKCPQSRDLAKTRAMEYLQRAVDLGHGRGCIASQYLLGRIMVERALHPLNVACEDRELRKGFALLSMSASGDHPLALYTLAALHDDGVGADYVEIFADSTICRPDWTPSKSVARVLADKRRAQMLHARRLYIVAVESGSLPKTLRSKAGKRIDLLGDCLDCPEICALPWYSLFHAMYLWQVRTRLQVAALGRTVHRALELISARSSKTFDPKIIGRASTEIASIFLANQPRFRPQGMLRPAGKSEGHPTTRMMQLARVKQLLSSYGQSVSNEELEHLQDLVAEVAVLAKSLVRPYEHHDPEHIVTATLMRMSGDATMRTEISRLLEGRGVHCENHLPHHDLEWSTAELSRTIWDWKEGKVVTMTQARVLWSSVSPQSRTLGKLLSLYAMGQTVYDFDRTIFDAKRGWLPTWMLPMTAKFRLVPNFLQSVNAGLERVLKVAPVVLALMGESNEVDPCPHHHYHSAMHLLVEAYRHGETWRQAQDRLIARAEQAHLGQSASRAVFIAIGFHHLGSSSWQAAVRNSLQDALAEAQIDQERKLNALRDSHCLQSFDREWTKSGYGDGSLLVQYERTKALIRQEDNERISHASTDEEDGPRVVPEVSLPRCTFEDPWSHHFDAGSHFSELLEQATSEYAALSADEKKGSSVECVTLKILSTEVNAKVQCMTKAVPKLHKFLTTLPLHDGSTSTRIAMLKKVLLFLRAVCDDWDNADKVSVVAFGLHASLSGRCQDGFTQFFDTFSVQHRIASSAAGCGHHNSGATSPSMRSLQLQVAALLQDYRMLFLWKHCTRFNDSYEGRTASFVMLTQMLRLPLSLPGDYVLMKYPHMAGRDVDVTFTAESLVSRFLFGGRLRFSRPDLNLPDYDERIEPLDLHTIGSLLRSRILPSGHVEPVPATSVGLAPESRVTARILEETLIGTSVHRTNDGSEAAFFENDPVLSTAWTHFKGSHYTARTKFFKPPTANSVPFSVGQSITDAGIVRLLEVAGYIQFVSVDKVSNGSPDDHANLAYQFYASVGAEWAFKKVADRRFEPKLTP